MPKDITITDPFKNLSDLLAVYSDATLRLAELENEINQLYLDLVDDKKSEYAQFQTALTDSEAALELVCRAHPQWFEEKRSIKTPYGSVAFKRSTKLLVPNEELSVELIRSHETAIGEQTGFIRTVEVLDREALEKLDDTVLKKFRISRSTSDEFSVKPVKLDLGKAVKASADREAKSESEVTA